MTIHRKAEKTAQGPVPAKLMQLCKEWHSKAVRWECLERFGKHGYRHCGLEIQVVHDDPKKPPQAAEVASALLAMMADHQDAMRDKAPEGYRIDAYDGQDVRLNPNGDFLRFADGEPDDLLDARDKGTWAFKALDQTHKRYIDLLDRVGPAIAVATDALDALTAVVADAIQIRTDEADRRLESEEDERKHERRMRIMDFLMENSAGFGFGGSGKSDSPLADTIDAMPKGVEKTLRDGFGEDLFSAFVAAAKNPDRATRSEQIQALAKRLNMEPRAVQATKDIPKKWRDRFQAALMAEVKAGL